MADACNRLGARHRLKSWVRLPSEAEQYSRDAGGPLIPPVNPPGPPCILRIADVVERVGLGRSSVWRMVKEHQFPRPRRLSPNAVGWFDSRVEEALRNNLPLPPSATYVEVEKLRPRLERAIADTGGTEAVIQGPLFPLRDDIVARLRRGASPRALPKSLRPALAA
jgi:prophage regulatory protein